MKRVELSNWHRLKLDCLQSQDQQTKHHIFGLIVPLFASDDHVAARFSGLASSTVGNGFLGPCPAPPPRQSVHPHCLLYTENLSLRLEAAAPEMMPEILSLLREAFGAQPDSPNLEPGLLRWKYFDHNADPSSSRSYALRKGDMIAAHACAWPIRIATPRGPVNAVQMLDWAASKRAPGSGVLLARKLEEIAPVLITTGGSEATQEVLPKVGFTRRTPFGYYARVLRPWRQFRTRPREGRKDLPRLIRNTLWSRSPTAPVRGWSSRALPHPDAELLARLDAQPVPYPQSFYSPAFLEFMLRCPAAEVRYFSLIKDSSAQGYFLLARVGGQARLANLRVLSIQPDDSELRLRRYGPRCPAGP